LKNFNSIPCCHPSVNPYDSQGFFLLQITGKDFFYKNNTWTAIGFGSRGFFGKKNTGLGLRQVIGFLPLNILFPFKKLKWCIYMLSKSL
jgi:hypothetical protein